jgi:hypothetical protein
VAWHAPRGVGVAWCRADPADADEVPAGAKAERDSAGYAFAAVDDVAAVQAICDGLDEGTITALAARLLAVLPHPFTAENTAAGYRYELSVLQVEFSATRALDAPVNERIFFDQLIRDNLDIGRPGRVSLIFDRKIAARGKRATPGPVPHPRHHRWSHPEPAHRLQELQDQAVPRRHPGRAHPADHQPGRHPHRRDAHHQPARAGLLAALCVFRLPPGGLLHRDVRTCLVPLLGLTPTGHDQRAAHLRRLRIHGLICRIPHSFRYQVTATGIRQALFLTRLIQRSLTPALAELTDPSPPAPSRLRAAARAYEASLDDLARQAGLAA